MQVQTTYKNKTKKQSNMKNLIDDQMGAMELLKDLELPYKVIGMNYWNKPLPEWKKIYDSEDTPYKGASIYQSSSGLFLYIELIGMFEVEKIEG